MRLIDRNRPVLIVLFSLIASMLFGCATLTGLSETPRVSLVGIAPVDLQLFEQRFRVSLRIQNPNDHDITIRGLDYEIVINEKVFAQGVSGKPVSVPAWGESIAEVEVVSSLDRIIDQLHGLGERSDSSIDYALSGHVRIDGVPFPIPFQYGGTLALPGSPGSPGSERRGNGGQEPRPRAPKALAI